MATKQLGSWPEMVTFLEDVFGAGEVENVWTAGFRDIAQPSWHGRGGLDHLQRRFSSPDELDLYFCIGRMSAGARSRTLGEVEGQPLLIVDDIGTKVDPALWDGLFAIGMPLPTFRIVTSPGNETWGWALEGDDRTPERATDMALIRAWLPARGLTDDVMDATRYIRMPGGWNSKPKYSQLGGRPPAVGLVAWDQGTKVSLHAIGLALFGRDDWRDADMPAGNMTSGQLGAALAAGALSRVADMNNPEPLIRLAQEVGLNPEPGSVGGVVAALCPNWSNHGDRAETGFAFLGNGLCHCMHATCQSFRSPDFRAMMEAQYDAKMEMNRALGIVAIGAPETAGEFLARATFAFLGVDFDAELEAVTSEAAEIAGRAAAASEGREAVQSEGVAALAGRYVWVVQLLAFFDTVDRELLSRDQFDTSLEVKALFEVGHTGLKRASNVVLNHAATQVVQGLTYKPGATAGVVSALSESGASVPSVNGWLPGTVGRRVGRPDAWFELLDWVLPDLTFREYYLDVCAFYVQKPNKRTTVIPVICGEQGVGKDLIFFPLHQILGVANVKHVNAEQLRGSFDDYLRAQVVVLDELQLSGDGSLYAKLKTWTGQSAGRVTVNPKYGRQYSFEPTASFIATANGLDALRGLEHDDRRCAVYVTPAVKNAEAWYVRIGAALETRGELERVHEFLATRDISKFNEWAPAPEFDGGRTSMLVENLSSAALWTYEQCQPGGLFEHRQLITIKELEAACAASATRTISNQMSAVAGRQGLLAAGCEMGGRGRAGKSRVSFWFGPGASEADRVRFRLLGSGAVAAAAAAEREAENAAVLASVDHLIHGEAA